MAVRSGEASGGDELEREREEESSGGGERRRRAPGRVQVREGGTGRPGSSSAMTCHPWLARWHSTEQLGCAGRGRRRPCPWWAGWAGWAGSAWATGKDFPIFLFNLSFLFLYICFGSDKNIKPFL